MENNVIFKKILLQVLTVGNVLNADTKNFKRADGFNLDSLSQVSRTKDVNNKINLLTYITSIIKTTDESIETIRKQFPGVAESSKILFSDVANDVNKMKKKVKENCELLKNITSTELYYSKLTKFYGDCSKEIDILDKDLTTVTEHFQKLILFYGYTTDNSKYKNPEEFFEMIDKFLCEVERHTPKSEIKKTFKGNNEKGAKVTTKNMDDVLKGIQQSRVLIEIPVERKLIKIG